MFEAAATREIVELMFVDKLHSIWQMSNEIQKTPKLKRNLLYLGAVDAGSRYGFGVAGQTLQMRRSADLQQPTAAPAMAAPGHIFRTGLRSPGFGVSLPKNAGFNIFRM
jgi:hypothetical protein